MNEHTWRGFAEEFEKMAKKRRKSSLPWALARGITSGGAGALYGLVPAIGAALATRKLPKFKTLLATSGIGAATGLGVGFGKGMAEKEVETAIKKMIKKRKK